MSITSPHILFPFILITLIWGSTWIVIRDQLGVVPASWSVTYRFLIAAAAMFVVARASGASLRIGREGHMLAAAFGLPQFFLNFNFVYAAEHHITSGLVAVVFALLLVPNSALAWLFLKQRVTRQFAIGSLVAAIGVALLFVQEMRASEAAPGEVMLGIGLTLLGVLCASSANVLQASERLKRRPMASMLAWGMVYGLIANAAWAFFLNGPPVVEYRLGYWLGLLYLGLIASALAFTLYFGIVRKIGPGKAAYSSILVPVIAMALSTIFENYVWSTLAAAGGALAMIGMVIALKARSSG
ncbi:MAG: DMT family transporter [Sphingosinicella sp.]|nr:DMT family transporter [Sphingosinicella sp.]